ncbi:MAG: DUF1217 domain-containing protein [Rhizobiaceae bacterium]|nr:DUF1217 domain-containing protein [Rhizobiaceae bacterium]
MTSLTTYQFYTRDTAVTRARMEADPIISREMAYYKENITQISTVDEFLDDDRLYNYAMKAFGLEELTYAKGLMRQVLESDLNDENSFANLLEDTRYKTMAAAFDFGNTVAEAEIQTDDQFEDTVDLYSTAIERRNTTLVAELDYYEAVIATVTDVDDIFYNETLRDQLFQAFDIDPEIFDYNTIRSVLTSDPDDPTSYVNVNFMDNVDTWQTQVNDLYALRDDEEDESEYAKLTSQIEQYQKFVDKAYIYQEMAGSFNFSEDGTLAEGVSAQSTEQVTTFKEKVILAEPELTRSAMLINQDYYREQLAAATSVEDLVYNIRLSEIILSSFGLPTTTSFADMIWAMTEDISDPDHEIYDRLSGFVDMANAFNFNADGSIPEGEEIQTAEQTDDMMILYSTRYDDEEEEARLEETSRFSGFIDYTSDLDDLLSDLSAAQTVRNYLLRAHDIGEDELSTFQLKKILTSDTNDPDSYVNQLGDERYRNLAKSLNFDLKGEITSPSYAQEENEITRIAKAYYTQKTMFDSSEETAALAEEEVLYYRERLGEIETVDEIVADARLVEFIAISEGMTYEDMADGVLGLLLRSDLDDPTSYANSFEDVRYQKIAGSFSFDEMGRIEQSSLLGVQSERGLVETEHLYVTQSIEEEAGETEVGARLALYFARMAPTITSVYELLADEALGQFTRTTLSLAEETASADIDKQAQLIESRLEIQDLQDSEKVNEMINRFLVLYDLENGISFDPTVAAFSDAASFSADTLAAYAQVRSQL